MLVAPAPDTELLDGELSMPVSFLSREQFDSIAGRPPYIHTSSTKLQTGYHRKQNLHPELFTERNVLGGSSDVEITSALNRGPKFTKRSRG